MAARATVTAAKPAESSVYQPFPGITQAQSYSIEERIRVRAYELYLERGGANGSSIDDWLRAETEICAEISDDPDSAS